MTNHQIQDIARGNTGICDDADTTYLLWKEDDKKLNQQEEK